MLLWNPAWNPNGDFKSHFENLISILNANKDLILVWNPNLGIKNLIWNPDRVLIPWSETLIFAQNPIPGMKP